MFIALAIAALVASCVAVAMAGYTLLFHTRYPDISPLLRKMEGMERDFADLSDQYTHLQRRYAQRASREPRGKAEAEAAEPSDAKAALRNAARARGLIQ